MSIENINTTVDTKEIINIYEEILFSSSPMYSAVRIPPKANPKMLE